MMLGREDVIMRAECGGSELRHWSPASRATSGLHDLLAV